MNQRIATLLGATRRRLSAGGPEVALLFDSISSVGQGGWNFGNAESTYYAGHEFFSDLSAHTVHKMVFKLSKAGSSIAGKTFAAKIWADASPHLGALIGTSDPVTGSDGWDLANVAFPFSTPVALVAGASYHLTIGPTGASDSGSFVNAWYTQPSLIPGQLTYFGPTGVNHYPTAFGGYDLQLQLWGTTP